MAAASIAGSSRRAASRRASSAPATPLSSTPRTPRRSSPVCGASRSSASCIARRAWRMCSSSSPAGICATDALDRGLAPQFPRLAQALGRLRALQPGRSADPAFRPRLRAGGAAAVGRGDVVYRLLRRRHAVLGDHVHRLVRIDVFRLLSHARPEDLGRHPLCAGHHRRRGSGEIVWAASKAWLSGATILAVAAAFGLAASPIVVMALPVAFLVGLAFAAVGLIMTVLAKNWDFFSFYMTLIMTPMTMISGVFFPAEQLPAPVLAVAQALPLYHGIELVRPLVAGSWPTSVLVHVAVLLAYAAAGYAMTLVFARRRFST